MNARPSARRIALALAAGVGVTPARHLAGQLADPSWRGEGGNRRRSGTPPKRQRRSLSSNRIDATAVGRRPAAAGRDAWEFVPTALGVHRQPLARRHGGISGGDAAAARRRHYGAGESRVAAARCTRSVARSRSDDAVRHRRDRGSCGAARTATARTRVQHAGRIARHLAEPRFEDYERVAGLKVARFVVQQTNDTSDGLRRAWAAPGGRRRKASRLRVPVVRAGSAQRRADAVFRRPRAAPEAA